MRRGIAVACAAAVPLALLVGCAQIPTSGPVDRGDQVQGPEDDPPVRVLPRGPVPGQTAIEVVKGFLDASASFEDDHAVARRFLTDGAAKTWNPEAGVTVIDDNPLRSFGHDGSSVELDAEQTAQITPDGAFLPRGGVPITRTFGMKREGEFWRIADVPQGLVLDRIEVSLAFRAFDIYFMNPQPQGKQSFLVADPVYLPVEQSGSATSLVQALLDGPTRWLSPAVESMIPSGTRLVVESVPIQNGVAQVDLSAEFLDAPDTEALEMAAAQITSTLLELSSSVTGVAISVAGSPLQLPSAPSVFTADTWGGFDPDALSPAIGAVFVRDGVVRTLNDEGATGRVQGALGDGRHVVVAPSQSWSGDIITALDPSHTRLLVTHPFVSGRVSVTRAGAHLLPATIDGNNRLWSLDVGGHSPDLRVLEGERWHRAILRAPRGDIESFQVSSDGARAAIVIRRDSGAGRSKPGQLMVGRLVQGANQLRVEAFRRIELTLRRARDASWVDATTLVVLGSSSGAAVEPLLVNIDRSVTSPSNEVAGGLTSVVGAPSLPLLAADSDGDILEATGTGWQAVVRGEYPAYPG